MQINTNISSLTTRNFLRSNNSGLEKAMERLSSGKRINTAADDAAGLAISTRMTTQVRGKEIAMRNAEDGISLIQTAESALGSIGNILQRMRELAVQADNGTNSDNDKASLKSEMDQLLEEIENIATKTTFNGINLLDGSADSGIDEGVILHIGDGATDTMGFDLTDSKKASLGWDADNNTATGNADGLDLTLNAIDITDDASWVGYIDGNDYTGAQAAIKTIDKAIDQISAKRAELGAISNRLDFTVSNLTSAKANTEASRSRILDADMAKESSNMTKAKVLSQSSIAMLSQANQNPQMVLQLLQN